MYVTLLFIHFNLAYSFFLILTVLLNRHIVVPSKSTIDEDYEDASFNGSDSGASEEDENDSSSKRGKPTKIQRTNITALRTIQPRVGTPEVKRKLHV